MPNKELESAYELPLRQQMLMVFTLVMLIFSISLVFIVDKNLKSSALNSSGKQSGQNAVFFASMLDNDIEQELNAIQSRADNLNDMGLPKKLDKLQVLLDNLKRSKPNYSWIGYTDLEGKVLAATDGMLKGADVSQRPWFQLGLRKAGTVDVHEAVLLAKLLKSESDQPLRFIDVVAPVKSRDGTPVGVLGAHLSVDWLNQQMSFYVQSLLHSNEYQPTVIGKDDKVRFGRNLDPELVEAVRRKQKSSNSEMQWFVYNSPKNEEFLVTFANHRGTSANGSLGWITVLATPISQIDEQIRMTRIWASAGILIASLAAWLTLWWLLRLAGQPVRALMREITKSRESHEPLEIRPGLPKEFNEITLSINEFLISIQSRELLLEQAMADMRDSFTGVTESFPGVLFRVEEVGENDFVFSYLSPSALHYLNLDITVLPISTEKFYEQVDAEHRLKFKTALRDQAFKSENLDITIPIRGKDTTVRQLRVRGRIRLLEKDKRIWDGVMVNVTDLLEARKMATEADEAKSKFLATMSHEIRTPLNGILGFAQILLQEVESEQQKSDVRKIIETSETLTRILNDILDFSKIEEGKLQIESRPFELSELVESSASLFHVEAQKRGIDFTVEMILGHSHRLLGDPTRLRQILSNLLSNALKFTSEGSVRLKVQTSVPVDNRSRLHIIVSDTGIGMSQEQQARLFQRFEQSDSSIFRRYGGSGLGLAIVKGLLDAMGGRIVTNSSTLTGTTFDIELDLPVIQVVEMSKENEITKPIPKLNILVVDDVETNRELICRFLIKEGHSVIEAENGQLAAEMASSQNFDIILMDVDMPVCNGIEATRIIRSGMGRSKDAWIIALTGYAFEKDIANVLACGMNAHLAKPINFKKLRDQILAGLPT